MDTDGLDYGEAEAYVRMLERAVADRELDDAGVLEELGKAARQCEHMRKHHSDEADRYMLARAAYVAEAHRRTVLAPDGAGRRSAESRSGRFVQGVGFAAWARSAGISANTANVLVRIGNAPDPLAMLRSMRKKGASYQKKNRVKKRTEALKGARMVILHDPVRAAKRAWEQMDHAQQMQFLRWTLARSAGRPDVASEAAEIAGEIEAGRESHRRGRRSLATAVG